MDLHDSILTLGFATELSAMMLQVRYHYLPAALPRLGPAPHAKPADAPQTYLDNRDEIRRILDTLSVKLPTYNNLEWRADVQVLAMHPPAVQSCSAADCQPNPATAH